MNRKALCLLIADALAVGGCKQSHDPGAGADTGGSKKGDFGPPQGEPIEAVLTAPPMVPPATGRSAPAKVIVELDVIEKEISEGATYTFWTFDGTVPGSFIRVRQGDTVKFRLCNMLEGKMPHNIDLHGVTTIVYLSGGVLGMFHHLYFAGTTTAAVAFGASFSALEVVPLALIGLEAYETWKHGRATPWMECYRWPIMFFLAVSFWNLVGAGLFGFLINTPIALYYMQGLNLTPLHGHTALFGVYGMLGIGLMLFCLRGLTPGALWHTPTLKGSFWAFNIGLMLMALLTLLPMGTLQLQAALENGYWYARSAEFMGRPIIEVLVWMRMPGDSLFSVGAVLLAWFVGRHWIAPRVDPAYESPMPETVRSSTI